MNRNTRYLWWLGPPLLLITIGIATLLSQSPVTGSRIRLNPADLDLGLLTRSEQQISLPIYNDGGDPLRIEVLSTSCGCVSVIDYDKRIAPHGEGHIVCNVTADGFGSGETRHQILLSTNDRHKLQTIVTIRYRTAPASPIRVAPRAIRIEVSTQELAHGTGSSRHQVLLLDAVHDTLMVTSIRSSPHIQAALHEVRRTCSDGIATHGFRIDVRLLPSLPSGPFDEWIRIETNCDDTPTVVVPVTGSVTNNTLILPRTVVLGSQVSPDLEALGEHPRATLSLRNPAGPVHVAALETDDSWLAARVTDVGNREVIDLAGVEDTLTDSQMEAPVLSTRVHVRLDAPVPEEHVIDVYWIRQ